MKQLKKLLQICHHVLTEELDPVTLHNQALMNMESNPTSLLNLFFYFFWSNFYLQDVNISEGYNFLLYQKYVLCKENQLYQTIMDWTSIPYNHILLVAIPSGQIPVQSQ